MRRLFWILALLALAPGSCAEKRYSITPPVYCGTPGLESEPCAVAGEVCPCSGFECPTYTDGFCTAVCSDELLWTLEDCKRARPFEPGLAGAGGEAGAAGAAGAGGDR